MTDEELPDDNDGAADGEETGDLPPPSTWAGRARKDQENSETERQVQGMTEEFDGIEAELSAGFDDLSTDEHEELERSEADEQEEPPADVEFEDDESGDDSDDGPEADADEAEAGEAEAEEKFDPSKTMEANTLALADAEAAKEAAAAGLTARAQKSSFSHERTTGSHKVTPAKPDPKPAPVAIGGNGDGVGTPPKRRMWWRFLAASVVIVASMAAATAVSFLLFLSDIAKGLNDEELNGARQELSEVEGGDPQTFLILGSDKRTGTPGDNGRSDTTMLLRVDPEKDFMSLLSIPRDLEVPIPGGYGEDKINAAYSYGGPELTLRTVKEYLGIPINHVVNVDFEGFYEAVNAIDCVYIDVDHDYFHSNDGLYGDALYAEIDVDAGYQKLCGYKALEYVRYRHGDNDLVRGARQQDFIREARQRIPSQELLPVFGTNELIDIFTKNTSSDVDDPATIIDLMKTFINVRNAPVRQVRIGEISPSGGVVASPEEVKTAVAQFLGTDLDQAPAEEQPAAPAEPKPEKDQSKPEAPKPDDSGPALVDSTATGQQYANNFAKFMEHRKVNLPIFYPTQIVSTANATISQDSRAAVLAQPEDEKDPYYMYKFVMPINVVEGQFYGVSGTNWLDPPILKNPSEVRTIDGRDYELFFEKDRLRLIAWQTSKGSYWVNNTLTHALDEDQMIGIATATRELGD